MDVLRRPTESARGKVASVTTITAFVSRVAARAPLESSRFCASLRGAIKNTVSPGAEAPGYCLAAAMRLPGRASDLVRTAIL